MSSGIRDFVMGYLELAGHEVRSDCDCYIVRFQSDPDRIHAITFSSEVARRGQCELVALGSPFFSGILEDTRRRGVAAARLPSANLEVALSSMTSGTCRAVLGAVEEMSRTALKLYYLLTCTSHKRSQRFVELALDASGQEAAWLYPVRNYINDEKPERVDVKELELVLDRSASILKKSVDQELKDLKDESGRLLASAVDRIQSYYAELRDETRNEAEFARSRAERPPSARHGISPVGISFEEAEGLVAEYDRLEELEIGRERARYDVRAEATIVGVLLVSYNVLRCHVKLQNEKASSEIVVQVLPNGDFDPPICEACNKPIMEMRLCPNGHVVGQECIEVTAPGETRCVACERDSNR